MTMRRFRWLFPMLVALLFVLGAGAGARAIRCVHFGPAELLPLRCGDRQLLGEVVGRNRL